MTTYRFRPVVLIHRATGACPVCGKIVRRERKFEQTVNPFNKNSHGAVKTEEEIQAELRAEAAEWVPDFEHRKCKIEPAGAGS